MQFPPRAEYRLDSSGRIWWCNAHQRRATHVRDETEHCCEPGLVGAPLPCKAVDLTEMFEPVPGQTSKAL